MYKYRLVNKNNGNIESEFQSDFFITQKMLDTQQGIIVKEEQCAYVSIFYNTDVKKHDITFYFTRDLA